MIATRRLENETMKSLRKYFETLRKKEVIRWKSGSWFQ